MDKIMKMVKSLEESGLLIKNVACEQAKEQQQVVMELFQQMKE